MFPPKEQTFVVTLQKQRQNIPWGISVVGGVDQGGPITITKVLPGSPGDKKLKEGDEITKIEDYDARDITHLNVYYLFQKAGTSIKLAIKRKANATKVWSSRAPAAVHQSSNPRSHISDLLPSASIKFAHQNNPSYSNVFKVLNIDDDGDAEQVKNQV
ncbi:hypothetical protein RUM43_010861 [Polyplax serrata]|uniref:PDZ domain-containing protein n=1 Tax=Polyplax serrata TaxID=468196 RepID=A0AAN8S3D6_POLSC